jgi:hypothetical protein
MVFCVFVFSVARESPSKLRITTISTTVARTHKYTINLGFRETAPEITPKEGSEIWVDVLKAHFEAETQTDVPQAASEGDVAVHPTLHGERGG